MNKPIIYAISDLHGELPDPTDIPQCDILLIGGDICPNTNHTVHFQFEWLRHNFKKWLSNLTLWIDYIVMIPGNHDFVFQNEQLYKELRQELPCTILIDKAVEIKGVNIYGTPWTSKFGEWAFMREERELEALFAEIPHSLDILLSHGPPLGCADHLITGEHVGSSALASRLKVARPKVVVCGHIHDAYGGYKHKESGAYIYNVSQMNYRFEPVNKVVEIQLDE